MTQSSRASGECHPVASDGRTHRIHVIRTRRSRTRTGRDVAEPRSASSRFFQPRALSLALRHGPEVMMMYPASSRSAAKFAQLIGTWTGDSTGATTGQHPTIAIRRNRPGRARPRSSASLSQSTSSGPASPAAGRSTRDVITSPPCTKRAPRKQKGTRQVMITDVEPPFTGRRQLLTDVQLLSAISRSAYNSFELLCCAWRYRRPQHTDSPSYRDRWLFADSGRCCAPSSPRSTSPTKADLPSWPIRPTSATCSTP